MNLISSIIDSKNYIRNRLLELLRRIGSEQLFRSVNYNDHTVSIAQKISRHDLSERSILHHIERFALSIPETEQMFITSSSEDIPCDGDAGRFCEIMHVNYQKITQFINQLKIRDLYMQIDHPGLKSKLSVGWILQYLNLRESAVISETEQICNVSGKLIRTPWATTLYMRPVQKLKLK